MSICRIRVSPRGSISLARTAQARAWLMERDHVLPEDISALAPNVLRHRMGLTYRAEADGVTPDQNHRQSAGPGQCGLAAAQHRAVRRPRIRQN